jgi:hypothetical protein
MNYSEYLFANLLRKYDKKFDEMEYDLQFAEITELYSNYEFSRFNESNKSEHDCMIGYLKDKYIKFLKEGYNVVVKINTSEIDISNGDEIINIASKLFVGANDFEMVDTITEIDLDDYISLGGKTK